MTEAHLDEPPQHHPIVRFGAAKTDPWIGGSLGRLGEQDEGMLRMVQHSPVASGPTPCLRPRGGVRRAAPGCAPAPGTDPVRRPTGPWRCLASGPPGPPCRRTPPKGRRSTARGIRAVGRLPTTADPPPVVRCGTAGCPTRASGDHRRPPPPAVPARRSLPVPWSKGQTLVAARGESITCGARHQRLERKGAPCAVRATGALARLR